MKVKSFYFSKVTIKKVKRQATTCGKIFVNHISNKRLLFKSIKIKTQNSTQRRQIIQLKLIKLRKS